MTIAQWSLVVYAILEIIGLVWAVSGDNDRSGTIFGISTRDCRLMFWMVTSLIGTLIYGGIFWW